MSKQSHSHGSGDQQTAETGADTTAKDAQRCQGSSDLPVPTEEKESGLAARLGIWFVSAYRRYISPALPPSCRYRPTCSEYTLRAIRRYGLMKGGWLGIKRICRCHPFHSGGHDPVP